MALTSLQAAAAAAVVLASILLSASCEAQSHSLASPNDTSFSSSSLRHVRSSPFARYVRGVPPPPSSLLYFAPSLPKSALRDVLPTSEAREEGPIRRSGEVGRRPSKYRPSLGNRQGAPPRSRVIRVRPASLHHRSSSRLPSRRIDRYHMPPALQGRKVPLQPHVPSFNAPSRSATLKPRTKPALPSYERPTTRPPLSGYGAAQSGRGKRRYRFEYGMQKGSAREDFGHTEAGDDATKRGEYFVRLPDGRTQTVYYHANATGYYARVVYTEPEDSKKTYKGPSPRPKVSSPIKNPVKAVESYKITKTSRQESKGKATKPPFYNNGAKKGRAPAKELYKPVYLHTKVPVRPEEYHGRSSPVLSLTRIPMPAPLPPNYYQQQLYAPPYLPSYHLANEATPYLAPLDPSSLSYSQGHATSFPYVPPHVSHAHYPSPPLHSYIPSYMSPSPHPPPPPTYVPTVPQHPLPKHLITPPTPIVEPPHLYTPAPLHPLPKSHTKTTRTPKKSHSKTIRSSPSKSYSRPTLTHPKDTYLSRPNVKESFTLPSITRQSYTPPSPTKQPYVPPLPRQAYTSPTRKSLVPPPSPKQSSTPHSAKHSGVRPPLPRQSSTPPPPVKKSSVLPPARRHPYTTPPNAKSYVPPLPRQSYTPPPTKKHTLRHPARRQTYTPPPTRKSYAPPLPKQSYTPPPSTKNSYTTTWPLPISKSSLTLPKRKSHNSPPLRPSVFLTSTLRPPTAKPHPRTPSSSPSPPPLKGSSLPHPVSTSPPPLSSKYYNPFHRPRLPSHDSTPPPIYTNTLPPHVSTLSPVYATTLPPPHLSTPPPPFTPTSPSVYVNTPPPRHRSTSSPLQVSTPPRSRASFPRPPRPSSPTHLSRPLLSTAALRPPPPTRLFRLPPPHHPHLAPHPTPESSVVPPVVPVAIPVDNQNLPVLKKEGSLPPHRKEASRRRHDSRPYDEDDDHILLKLEEYDEAADDYVYL